MRRVHTSSKQLDTALATSSLLAPMSTVKIPSLRFQVKDAGKDADWGTLKNLKCTTRYEVKIVRIRGRTTSGTSWTLRACWYPSAEDRLCPGSSTHSEAWDARQCLLDPAAP